MYYSLFNFSHVKFILTKLVKGRPFNFRGGGGDFEKKNSCKVILNKKNTCTNKLWKKYPAQYLVGKDVEKQNRLQGSI
jgi:hypothetical protein